MKDKLMILYHPGGPRTWSIDIPMDFKGYSSHEAHERFEEEIFTQLITIYYKKAEYNGGEHFFYKRRDGKRAKQNEYMVANSTDEKVSEEELSATAQTIYNKLISPEILRDWDIFASNISVVAPEHLDSLTQRLPENWLLGMTAIDEDDNEVTFYTYLLGKLSDEMRFNVESINIKKINALVAFFNEILDREDVDASTKKLIADKLTEKLNNFTLVHFIISAITDVERQSDFALEAQTVECVESLLKLGTNPNMACPMNAARCIYDSEEDEEDYNTALFACLLKGNPHDYERSNFRKTLAYLLVQYGAEITEEIHDTFEDDAFVMSLESAALEQKFEQELIEQKTAFEQSLSKVQNQEIKTADQEQAIDALKTQDAAEETPVVEALSQSSSERNTSKATPETPFFLKTRTANTSEEVKHPLERSELEVSSDEDKPVVEPFSQLPGSKLL